MDMSWWNTYAPNGNKLNTYGKILKVLHFDPAPPPGACDVSEVWVTHRWTYSPNFGYCIITQTLNIALCL